MGDNMEDKFTGACRDHLESLDPMFYPDAVAVIGAGQDPRNPNGLPIPLLSNNGYQGDIYPVNPKYENVFGFKCYPSITDIPGKIDLAIIAVPAEMVMERLQECEQKGVIAVVIFSSGFAEVGEEGKHLQKRISEFASCAGIRILGPNCLGLLNYYNGNMASFFFHQLPEGLVHPRYFSFITQSGGVGSIIYQLMVQSGIGFNYFVSTGNEADITFAEVLEYLVKREEVSLIGGYLEGLAGEGKRLLQACNEALCNHTVITVMKMGRTTVGAEAASSHTGALVGEDRVYDALFKQKGVIRVEEVEEMSALAQVHAAGKLPLGNRVGIITVSGGGGVVVADKCPELGLEVVKLEESTREALQEFFPTFGATRNPVDLTSQIMVDPLLFQKAIRLVMADARVDVGLFFYDLDVAVTESIDRIVEVYHQLTKPLVVICWPSGNEHAQQSKKELISRGVPVLENISHGLGAISSLVEWKRKSSQASRYISSEKEKKNSREIPKIYPEEGVVTESRAKKLLAAYRIPVTREILCHTSDEAIQAAEELGYPVVLKIESPHVLHKTDAGGVHLRLRDSKEVSRGYHEIIKSVKEYNPDAAIEGVLVQEMLEPGLEVILGIKKDPLFGPIVMFGLGGVLVEVMEDISMRVAPLNREDAKEMVEEIKGYPVLEGVRGQPRRDIEALIEVILHLSRLAVDLEEDLEEMDINPLFLYPEGRGVVAADALMRFAKK